MTTPTAPAAVRPAPRLPAPTYYIFRGFIPESAAGLEDTNRSPSDFWPTVVPARLRAEAGFLRSCEYAIAGRQTCFGLRPARADRGEVPSAVNGVIQAARSPRARLVAAEGSFVELQPRPVAFFEAVSWVALPRGVDHIWVQVMAPQRVRRATLQQPLLQTYVDQQLARLRNVGGGDPTFAREFVDSTRNWPAFWLNDRPVPRRPWVHIERSDPKEGGGVQLRFNDDLLQAYPPPPYNRFRERKLEVEYASLVARDQRMGGDGALDREVAAAAPPQRRAPRDWTGSQLRMAATKHFMFGFGSLMNTTSRTASDPTAISVVPVRVSAKAGFARAWNFQHPTAAITALGVARMPDGVAGRPINGVCTPISLDGADVGADTTNPGLPQAVLDREAGYTPFPIPAALCEPLGWSTLPPGATVWLFVPDSPDPTLGPGRGLRPACESNPILQTYVDICILGCLEFSREFAIEFITSTLLWDGPWLNDRKVPRRPWVHQPQFAKIDALLQETIPAHFARRVLPEAFGLRVHQKRAATALMGVGRGR